MQNNANTAAALVLCLMCLAPAILGGLAGAFLQRRRQNSPNWFHALLPAWVLKLLERYQ